MITLNIDQGSPEWLKAKLGVISASNASKVLAGRFTDTRKSYMAELVAQVCTQEQEELNAKALSWGRDNEEAARAAYSFETSNPVEQVGFIYKDDSKRIGCSPDFKIIDKNRYGEIKVPMASRVFIEFLAMNKIKPEYMAQIQFSLWITGAETWEFINYNPRMKNGSMIHIQTIEPSKEYFNEFNEKVPLFISDMDLMLEKIGVKWGSQF